MANLAGCARAIPDPGLKIDNSITTASIQEAGRLQNLDLPSLDSDTLADAETIANAVSAVQFVGNAILWQNPATGSSGEIVDVDEQRLADGTLCRRFEAVRTSYDGIRNYQGSTCMNGVGRWQLTAFSPS